MAIQWGVAAGTNYTSGTLQANWGAVTTANRYVGQVNGAASNNNFFQITGAQLEAADEASEFEKLPYDINLQRCLRYCFVLPNSGNIANGPIGQFYSTSAGRVFIKFPVKMRATPTASNLGLDVHRLGVGTATATATANDLYSVDVATWDYTGISPTGTTYQSITGTGTGTFSAEL